MINNLSEASWLLLVLFSSYFVCVLVMLIITFALVASKPLPTFGQPAKPTFGFKGFSKPPATGNSNDDALKPAAAKPMFAFKGFNSSKQQDTANEAKTDSKTTTRAKPKFTFMGSQDKQALNRDGTRKDGKGSDDSDSDSDSEAEDTQATPSPSKGLDTSGFKALSAKSKDGSGLQWGSKGAASSLTKSSGPLFGKKDDTASSPSKADGDKDGEDAGK